MKLLIVDDDFHVIQGIQQNLHWEKLGVDQVFSALGACAAKPILQDQSIDIIICDIEMPKETGLELMDWVRANHMQAQIIFLTSYAKFEYAQRAIQLGSLEYILKPVDYHLLEKSVMFAAEEAKKSRQNAIFKQNNQFWEKNKRKVLSHFWNSVIAGIGAEDHPALENSIEECGLSYVKERVFLPVILQSEHSIEDKERTIKECVLDLTGKCFKAPSGMWMAEVEFFVRLSEYRCLFLLKAPICGDVHRLDPYVLQFMKALAQALEDKGLTLFWGVGFWNRIHGIYEDIQNMNTMMYESPRIKKDILYLHSYKPVKHSETAPDLKAWAELIRTEQTSLLLEQVEKYLKLLEDRHENSSKALQHLRMDMTQLIYAYLDSLNIYAHMLFNNEENVQMYGKAPLSSQHMLAYIQYVLDKSMSYKRKVEQTYDLPDTIKDYIDNHFQENITREELSRLVFLNPDYLSRLFKRKMGISISGYLIQKRIDLARNLLVTTKTPVSVISSQVGYDNFAYFTKIFRDKVGMSPNEYRKSFHREQ